MKKIILFTLVLTGTFLATCIHTAIAVSDKDQDINGLTLVQIYNNNDLKKIALEKGRAAFVKHCAECHGEDGTGKAGVPDLTNGISMWGPALSDVEITTRYGIRSGHALQRFSEMPAYGGADIFTDDQIKDLVEYTLSIAFMEADEEAANRAQQDFENICSECHDYSGTGRKEYYGAPDLTDFYWQYGDSRDAVYDSIAGGRKGVSPSFEDVLDNETIKSIVIYVYNLSHSW